jgi:peptidoglycan/xylan/chitin deacetylase (PgdA/CDA1 family)
VGAAPSSQPGLKYDHDGIVRGDLARKRLSIIFTAGDFGEGVPHILEVCRQKQIKTGFFVTGSFLRAHEGQARRIVADGHLLGPHSDQHLLYCDWNDREKSLVTEEQFKQDLRKNLEDLRRFGAEPALFVPPYEWFNRQHAAWAGDLGLTLINFTPGSGSNRDYIPERDSKFVSSQRILDDILAWEQKDPDGLNGFILLLHAGSQRTDKMHLLFGPLIEQLTRREYMIVRVDELIQPADELLVIRANQIGYLTDDPKIAILSSDRSQRGRFRVGQFDADIGADQGPWGPFAHNYRLDFSALAEPGRFEISFGDVKSLPFSIGADVYDEVTKKCPALRP